MTFVERASSYRWQVFVTTWLSYAGFYVTRRVISVVKGPMKTALHVDDLGVLHLFTTYLVAYMIGQFLAASMSKRLSNRTQALAGMPQDYRLTIKIKPGDAAGVYGFKLRDDGKQSIELKVDPEKKQLVLGHHTMPWSEPVTKLDVIVKGPAVDVCINDKQTIVTGRATHVKGDRIVIFRDDKPLEIESIDIRPLLAPK